jgi:hypothetical protein
LFSRIISYWVEAVSVCVTVVTDFIVLYMNVTYIVRLLEMSNENIDNVYYGKEFMTKSIYFILVTSKPYWEK